MTKREPLAVAHMRLTEASIRLGSARHLLSLARNYLPERTPLRIEMALDDLLQDLTLWLRSTHEELAELAEGFTTQDMPSHDPESLESGSYTPEQFGRLAGDCNTTDLPQDRLSP